MAVNSEKWLAKLSRLRVDRARGDPAPHKPLFLLLVLELAEEGSLPKDVLPLSPELAFRFFSFWNVVAHRRTQPPDVRLPFHHLQSDGFWSALDENGKLSPDRSLTQYAVLNEEFIAFAQEPALRNKARRILIEKYFQPVERIALCSLVGLYAPDEKDGIAEIIDDVVYYARQQGREARFRLSVVPAYDYTCALTGYRLITITAGSSIVDAAHIHQFADSRNNDPKNGLALSKNAHWLFDHGFWTISDDYTVSVAISHFTEQSPDQKALCDYHGQKIRLPKNSALWPNPIHLAWHRKNKFLGMERRPPA